MAPAVSRRPHTVDARVPHGLMHVRCVWEEEMGKTFVLVLRPCPVGIIQLVPKFNFMLFASQGQAG